MEAVSPWLRTPGEAEPVAHQVLGIASMYFLPFSVEAQLERGHPQPHRQLWVVVVSTSQCVHP